MSVVVYQYVERMHVADFLLYALKFCCSADHIVEEVPYLCFLKGLIDLDPVLDLASEDICHVLKDGLTMINLRVL